MMLGYALSTVPIAFNDAISYCSETYKSSLATIFTSQQNHIVLELCATNGTNNCWIGLHKQINNNGNDWYWIHNNITTNFTQWSTTSNNESCAEMIVNTHTVNDHLVFQGEWNKIPCNVMRYPICNAPTESIGLYNIFWFQ